MSANPSADEDGCTGGCCLFVLMVLAVLTALMIGKCVGLTD